MTPSIGATEDFSKASPSFGLGSIAKDMVLFAIFARFGALGAASVQVAVVVFLAVSGIVVGLRFTNWTLRDLLNSIVPGITVTLATVAGASAVDYLPIAIQSPIVQRAGSVSAGFAAWGLALVAILRLRIVPRRFAVL
jgi:hypothetical protein